MSQPLRLLQVEDSESDAELIVRRLTIGGYSVGSKRVDSAEEMRAALGAREWDVIICDFAMPGFSAPAALALLRETGLDIPFLVVSGTIGEELAVSMMKAGAHDYLMKDNLTRLPAAVARELGDARTRAERREALGRLKESEAQLAMAIHSTELGIFDQNLHTGEVFYSDLARRHLRVPASVEPSFESFLNSVHPEDRSNVADAVAKAMRPEGSGYYTAEYRLKELVDGEERWISAWGRVTFDADGKPARFVGAVRDVSDRKIAEREMQFQLQLTASISEQSTDCIVFTDREGKIRFVNPETKRVFGFTAAEMLGKDPHELFHHQYPDGRPYPAAECRLSNLLLRGGVVREHEDVFFRKDGNPVDVSVSAAPLDFRGTRIGLVSTFRDITGRKRAEQELRRSEARFRRLFEADILGIVVADNESVLECNDYFLRILGYAREEFFSVKRRWAELIPPEYYEAAQRAVESLRRTGVCPPFEKEYYGREKSARIPILFAAVALEASESPHALCFVIDLTERKNLENQFRQAQKLESVGQLAGGVAHDFNNLLTVIMGYSNAVLDQIEPTHPLNRPIKQVAAAAERAAGLTRQLLTFSRSHVGLPKTIPLDDLVRGIEQMLSRLIDENIEIVVSTEAPGGLVHADPGLVEQVVINLAINARDAMPAGGRLTISTGRRTILNDSTVSGLAVPPGEYVELSVSDTGIGMTADVQARIFEPFFTTKEPGKGTGLGLSTVYGIVRQSGGSICVDSHPGKGTTMLVVFPAADPKPVTAQAPEVRPIGGTGAILLVEDQDSVREYIGEVLRANGYIVVDAAGGEQALAAAAKHGGHFDLLLTDVVLPGMSAGDIVARFRALWPDAAVLCMSGYPARFGVESDMAEAPLLQKPFTASTLLRRIGELLETRARGAEAGG